MAGCGVNFVSLLPSSVVLLQPEEPQFPQNKQYLISEGCWYFVHPDNTKRAGMATTRVIRRRCIELKGFRAPNGH